MIVARDPRRVLFIALAVVLAGATAFGLWHVVLGGMVNGNLRAAGFGIVLAAIAGSLLAAVVAGLRRERRA